MSCTVCKPVTQLASWYQHIVSDIPFHTESQNTLKTFHGERKIQGWKASDIKVEVISAHSRIRSEGKVHSSLKPRERFLLWPVYLLSTQYVNIRYSYSGSAVSGPGDACSVVQSHRDSHPATACWNSVLGALSALAFLEQIPLVLMYAHVRAHTHTHTQW